jgi:hypothetical protein
MPDLIALIPNHGYADETPVQVSWLDDNIYYVHDPSQNSFKLEETVDGNVVQFTETVTDGFVREDNETATTTISGLDHLEAETVTLTSGGEVVGSFLVTNGSITLNSELTTYQVGLPYRMKVRTMRLSVPQQGNTLQTRIKRINETVVRYVRSKLGKAGQEYDGIEYLENLTTTFSTESQDDTKLTRGGMTTDAYTTITSDEPMPFTVLSTIISFEIEETR